MKTSTSTPLSTTSIQAALGGGLATALLSIVTTPPLLAVACSLLAPFPIMLVAMAFGWMPGLAAAVIGAGVVAFFQAHAGGLGFAHPEIALSGFVLYALNLAMPAWILARLMASAPVSKTTVAERDLTRVITTGILLCIGILSVDFGIVILASGGLTTVMETLTHQLDTFYDSVFTIDNPLPKGTDKAAMIKATIAIFPIATVSMWMLIAALNTWLAARLTKAIGLAPLPWPDLPRCFRVPRLFALVFAVSLGLAFAGGIIGLFALVVSNALIFAFAAQGLATLHEITRAKSYRLPLLIIVYLLLPSLFLIYALLGLADAGFALRDRFRPGIPVKI